MSLNSSPQDMKTEEKTVKGSMRWPAGKRSHPKLTVRPKSPIKLLLSVPTLTGVEHSIQSMDKIRLQAVKMSSWKLAPRTVSSAAKPVHGKKLK